MKTFITTSEFNISKSQIKKYFKQQKEALQYFDSIIVDLHTFNQQETYFSKPFDKNWDRYSSFVTSLNGIRKIKGDKLSYLVSDQIVKYCKDRDISLTYLTDCANSNYLDFVLTLDMENINRKLLPVILLSKYYK